MRPLEKRFPTLYFDIVDEYNPDPKVQKTEEKRTPRATSPSLYDVIQKVLDSHKVSAQGVTGDLTETISEFLGLDEQPKTEAVMPAAPSAMKAAAPPPPVVVRH